jgi:hypothetical protein
VALPDCEARIVHAPVAMSVTVLPLTVQTDVVWELKVTNNPDDAVALTANGALPNTLFGSVPNVIVCAV